jgi:hypothetical protein
VSIFATHHKTYAQGELRKAHQQGARADYKEGYWHVYIDGQYAGRYWEGF